MENTPNKYNKLPFFSLIIGFLGIIPVIGAIPFTVSIILGIIAIKHNARKGLAITAIIIASILFLIVHGMMIKLVMDGERKVEEYKNSPEYLNR